MEARVIQEGGTHHRPQTLNASHRVLAQQNASGSFSKHRDLLVDQSVRIEEVSGLSPLHLKPFLHHTCITQSLFPLQRSQFRVILQSQPQN